MSASPTRARGYRDTHISMSISISISTGSLARSFSAEGAGDFGAGSGPALSADECLQFELLSDDLTQVAHGSQVS